MAHTNINKRNDVRDRQDNHLSSKKSLINRRPEESLFYELEAAIVLEVVRDANYKFTDGDRLVFPFEYPNNIQNGDATKNDPDLGWVGAIKFRFINTNLGASKDVLEWAFPLENTGVVELPLVNETVVVVKYFNRFYYSRKINLKSIMSSNADFGLELGYGTGYPNTDDNLDAAYPSPGPVSDMGGSTSDVNSTRGNLGKYYTFNPHVRALKHYEGDTAIESRFGSSIRFGGYEELSSVNLGASGYTDYPKGSGSPHILIRNRQGDVSKKPSDKQSYYAKGHVTESINNDGSSIHLTSGLTTSDFKTTCKKVMFQAGVAEEQPAFSPDTATEFEFPKMSGDQIIINSNRLVFSSRTDEMFSFAKKRYSVVTDGELTLDAHKQVVVTTNDKVVLNSPKIYLGEHGDADEPVLLGRTSVYWMHQLCEWMLNQCNWQISLVDDWLAKHDHLKDTQGPKPPWVSKSKEFSDSMKAMRDQLIAHQKTLPTLMSTRVFTVGGGGAPGHDGGQLS